MLVISVKADTLTLDSKIDKVTVYSDLARVHRIGNISLPVGDHSIVFENLPWESQTQSYRASVFGLDGLTLLGLNHTDKQHLETPHEKVALFEKRITIITQDTLRLLHDRMEVLKQQKGLLMTMLEGPAKEAGREAGVGEMEVNRWAEAYDFLGKRMSQVVDSIGIISIKIGELRNELSNINDKLRKIKHKSAKKTRIVQVDIRMTDSGEVNISLEYLIRGASWTPIYDARMGFKGDTVEIGYLAEVFQRTGEDWKDIELSLSTSRPLQATSPGELNNWQLSILEPERPSNLVYDLGNNIRVKGRQDQLRVYETANQTTIYRDEIETAPVTTVDQLLAQTSAFVLNSDGNIFIRGGKAGEVSYIVDGVPVNDPLGSLGVAGAQLSLVSGSISAPDSYMYNTVFTVQRKETVLSGEQSVRTAIAQWKLEGEIELISRPRNREGTYRFVKMTNSEEAPLLPGNVNLFVGQDFLGKTSINSLIVPGEEFKMFFGRDNNIRVVREIVDRKKKYKKNKVVIYEVIKITVENKGLYDRIMTLEESLPISADDRIKVKIKSITPDVKDEKNKYKAEWEVIIPAGEKQIFTIEYILELPRNETITGLG